MKSNPFNRFVTNNHRFKPEDLDYGKVYFVNVVLLGILLICASYLIPNIIISYSIHILIINITALIVALTGLVYFHKTDQVTKMGGFFVAFLFILLFYYTIMAESSHHFLYWLVIFPPIIFFVLGHNKAKVVSFLYLGLLMVVIAAKYRIFDTEASDLQSLFNIIGPTIILLVMINFYERSRSDMSGKLELRNHDLAKINTDLSLNQEKLEILLASTEEGIYGINLKGECIFCNKSGLEFLGYNVESELLGQNMHEQIHSKNKEGGSVDIRACKIFRVFMDGKSVRVSDEVFWKKDGTSFDVEYSASPQRKGDTIVGVVITFRDISQEKAALEHMHYLNTHDWLTGVNNRSFFEKALEEMDRPENLPISVVFSDINRLKLTNDIFGHSAGDELLIKGAEILTNYIKEGDILARIGGDEFVIVLPRTDILEATKIQVDIQKHFASHSVNSFPCSMAVGCASKTVEDEEMSQTIINAEGEMYKEKTITRQSIHEDMVYSLINSLHNKSLREKSHSENVMRYSEIIGKALNMPITELVQLKKMAYFHDIGKLVLEKELLLNEGVYSREELARIKQHPAIAYRILNLFDETLDIAGGVYAHHENWDGTGYPKGLKGEEIPYMSRIISIAEIYDALTNRIGGNSLSKEEALKEIESISGSKLDPNITSVFLDAMSKEDPDKSYRLPSQEEEVNEWEDMM